MLMATFCFSLMNAIVKLLDRIPFHEIVFFRSLVSLSICLILLRRKKVHIWGNNKKILILRGVFGTAALFIYFWTIHNIPLATAVTIQHLSPLFTVIISGIILKEKVHPWQWPFFFLALLGVFLIKGIDTNISIVPIVLGVIAAILSASAYNCIRFLKKGEDPLVIILYFPLIATPTVGVISFTNWTTPLFSELVLLLLVGITTQLAQYYMTKAYQMEKAANIANLNYLGVVLALGYGFFFWGETPTIWNITGISLIVASVITYSKISRYLSRPK